MLTVKLSRDDFKSSAKWSQIAESLELPEGRDEAIVTRIPGLMPVEPGMKINSQIKQPDEWMVGESIDGKRQWIVHTRGHRFIAEIIDDEEDILNPPFEYQMRSGQWLCNFVWFDYPPADLTIVCMEAQEAIEMYDSNLGIDE